MDGIGTLAGDIAHDFHDIFPIIPVHSSRLLRGKLEPETIPTRFRKPLSQNGEESPPEATEGPINNGIQDQLRFSLRPLQRSAEKHPRSSTMIRGAK
jgi:hypothetical protein